MSGGGFRASIPSGMRKMIQNIKEITGNHSEEEIYAMLKECSMDPNETTQKLLFQDTFHEVKRKRDKKKENVNNKESTETRWRSGTQGRGGRGGRVNSSARFVSHDAGGGKNAGPGKENGLSRGLEKAVIPPLPVSNETKKESGSVTSPAHVVGNGPIGTSGSTSIMQVSNTSSGSGPQTGSSSVTVSAKDVDSTLNPVCANKSPIAFGTECPPDKSAPSSSNCSILQTPKSSSVVYFSSSDPVLMPSDSRVPGAVRAIKREVGGHHHPVSEIGSSTQGKMQIKSEGVDKNLLDESSQCSSTLTHSGSSGSSSNCSILQTPKSSSVVYFSSSDPVLMPSDSRVPGAVRAIKREVGGHHHPVSEIGSSTQGKMRIKSEGVDKNLLDESSQCSSTLTHSGSSGSRPSSNYSAWSQQTAGNQKVGSNKEWKPKPTSSAVQCHGTASSSDVSTTTVEATVQQQPNVLDSREATLKLQKKLEELHISHRQHVILPDHVHVPESERTKFTFGSFGVSFGVMTSNSSSFEREKIPIPESEDSQGTEEAVEEQPSSNSNALATTESGDYLDHVPSITNVHENLSSAEAEASSSETTGITESKEDTEFPSGGPQYSVVHTPTNSYEFVTPILGSQVAPSENSESQARDVSRLPGFVVQQPFDPTSYYAQFYRSNADGDGRMSPFSSPGVAAKYNGNLAILSPPSLQSQQEGGALSTAGPTPLVTQAAGLMQGSIAVTQQPVPVFRPPTGMHITHYPPSYFPYGHYFPPFYVPPPAIHQYLGNGSFPQQPQAGGAYPAPPSGATAAVKYSLAQYKPGNNTGNSAHIGMPSGYGPYGSLATGYNPTATAGNPTVNEDISAAQFKESNVYIAGQQSEGSAVWVAAPGREMSSLPTSSFYNINQQGQHVTFTPTQAGHGTFAGIYHPAQGAVTAATVHPLLQQSQTMAGAVDMVGPGGSIYQQPQHAQVNWPSNY